MAIEVYSATESEVKVSGETIEGLQSIEYKVSRSRTDILAVGQPLRQGVEYGVKVISGKLIVKSKCQPLDERLSKANLNEASFSLSVQLKRGGELKRTVDLHDCYLDDREFAMDVNSVGIAIYTFTATELVES